MTDDHGHDHGHEPELHESPLPPADDERIRRLLAEARHTEPMPEAVAARLDSVLGDLSSERAERHAHEDQRAPVIELAARRRRTAANLLVAAAAVLAIGFGITQVLPDGMGGSDDSPTAATAEDAGGGSAADSSGSDSRSVTPDDGTPEVPTPNESDGSFSAKAFRIRSESFGADVRQLRRQVVYDAKAMLEYAAPTCLTADVGAGDVLAVTYDGAPAALVLRVPSGDVQVVDLYLCDDVAPRRSITLTAP
jgi:hypothetical protein